MTAFIYEDGARAASQVVGDPAVIESIRRAAGIEPPPDPDIIDPNPEYLTLDEIDKVEEMLGGPMDMMGKMLRRGPALRIVATVIKQRTDPDFTLELAGSLKIKFGESKPVPPTSDNGSAPSQPLSSTTE